MSLCKDCISGVRHEGTHEGKEDTINGVRVYIATPTIDYPKDKALLLLPDVFGIDLPNTRLLADDFARNGFYTVAIDYFNGDALPPDALNSPNFDLMGWLSKHGRDATRPPLNEVIAGLIERGVKEFGATGYCFGARYVVDLAIENVIQVSVISHPSLLDIPQDFETYLKESKAPLLINSCTIDQQFPHEKQAIADEIFGGGKFPLGYRRDYYEGCSHGFAVRGDLTDPKVKAGKEGSFKGSVEWFIRYL